jgi:hypothetical protein
VKDAGNTEQSKGRIKGTRKDAREHGMSPVRSPGNSEGCREH